MYRKRNNEFLIIGLYLGDYKKEFYLREISKMAKIPVKTTQTTLKHLEDAKILKGTISGKNKYFRLNLDNIQTKMHILQVEAYRTELFLEKYQFFKIFIKEIKENTPLAVFGSFAKLKADKDSDLDLLTIGKEKEELPLHLLPLKVQQIRLNEINFLKSIEKKETLIEEVKENHIILNNHSFFVNALWDYYGK